MYINSSTDCLTGQADTVIKLERVIAKNRRFPNSSVTSLN